MNYPTRSIYVVASDIPDRAGQGVVRALIAPRTSMHNPGDLDPRGIDV